MASITTNLLAISRADIERLVDPASVIDALAEGFKALSRGDVQAPPRPKIDVPGKGISLAMLAYAPAGRIALKTVNVYHHNHERGLESHQALVSLFDGETGVPLAILDGASLTGLRTAAGAILSVRELARPDARVALVVGSGLQAREHVRQLRLARAFERILVFARDAAKARAIASTVPNGQAATSLADAVRLADVVCLTTSSETPVIEDAWVRPGTHIASVGFAPPGSELPSALIERSRVFVEAISAFDPAPVGCAELAGRDRATGAELGEVLLGRKPGRQNPDEITLYKSMGNAMEDMVVANLAYDAALAAGAGQRVTL